jgi:hypothetical protein
LELGSVANFRVWSYACPCPCPNLSGVAVLRSCTGTGTRTTQNRGQIPRLEMGSRPRRAHRLGPLVAWNAPDIKRNPDVPADARKRQRLAAAQCIVRVPDRALPAQPEHLGLQVQLVAADGLSPSFEPTRRVPAGAGWATKQHMSDPLGVRSSSPRRQRTCAQFPLSSAQSAAKRSDHENTLVARADRHSSERLSGPSSGVLM